MRKASTAFQRCFTFVAPYAIELWKGTSMIWQASYPAKHFSLQKMTSFYCFVVQTKSASLVIGLNIPSEHHCFAKTSRTESGFAN